MVRDVKASRGFIDNPRLFDPVVVTLVGILVLGAYVTAYAYVIQANQVVQQTSTIGLYTVLASWLGLTANNDQESKSIHPGLSAGSGRAHGFVSG